MKLEIGIIGGSGIYKLLENMVPRRVETPYGTVKVFTGSIGGRNIVFLPRHGEEHTVPPSKINYRGNIFALAKLGVKRIIATNAVGSLNPNIPPGCLALPHDFIDFTKNRVYSFFDGKSNYKVGNVEIWGVAHVSMTPPPYCPELRDVLSQAMSNVGVKCFTDQAVYVCTEGNRFETAAEIKAFRILGGDLVGMTGVPEVVLARELALCYATICLVTNFAAGMISGARLTHEEVKEIFDKNIETVRKVIKAAVGLMPEKRGCAWGRALEGAYSTLKKPQG